MAELVIALDVPDRRTALDYAHKLRDSVNWLKIGLQLFVREGPSLVEDLHSQGYKIFLDLKFYDIPNTVAAAVASACAINADLLTLHCQGGERMCKAALDAAKNCGQSPGPLLFGVTVLTSFADTEMPGIDMPLEDMASNLAKLAVEWGLPGVVCSGREVESIKKTAPGLLCLCPGIRPGHMPLQDQRRAVTPGEAVRAGADFLVMGRPVLQAADPVAFVSKIQAEMAMAEQVIKQA